MAFIQMCASATNVNHGVAFTMCASSKKVNIPPLPPTERSISMDHDMFKSVSDVEIPIRKASTSANPSQEMIGKLDLREHVRSMQIIFFHLKDI